MAGLTLKNFAAFVQDQAAAIQGRTQSLIDFSVGSIMRALVESNAGVGLWLQSEMLKVLANTRAATSTGADLDSFVQDFGLFRLGAASAVGTVTFARFSPAAQAVIPIGATVQTVDGTQTFAVVADPTNAAFNVGLNGYVLGSGVASLDVPVEALTPGTGGNVQAGTIGFVTSSIAYVDTVTNAGAIVGGGDAESDASLRARFVDYIQSLRRGTVQAIRFAVMNLRLGLQATVLENLNADLTPNSGFLCITVATSDVNPVPTDAIMSSAYGQADAYRAGGIWIGVFTPNVVLANVQMTLVVDPQYDYQTLVGNVGTVIAGYVNGLKLGQTLYASGLTKLALETSPGVISVSLSAVNGAQGDLIVTGRDIIRAGTVSIS